MSRCSERAIPKPAHGSWRPARAPSGAIRTADRANEPVHVTVTGDPPADVGVHRQRSIDGAALGVVGKQFRSRQVEDLKALGVETQALLDERADYRELVKGLTAGKSP